MAPWSLLLAGLAALALVAALALLLLRLKLIKMREPVVDAWAVLEDERQRRYVAAERAMGLVTEKTGDAWLDAATQALQRATHKAQVRGPNLTVQAKAERRLSQAVEAWVRVVRRNPNVGVMAVVAQSLSELHGSEMPIWAAVMRYNEAVAAYNARLTGTDFRRRVLEPLARILGVGVARRFWFDDAP